MCYTHVYTGVTKVCDLVCIHLKSCFWIALQSALFVRCDLECGGFGVVICLDRGADCLRMVQLMPLPSQKPDCLLPRLNADWFYLSGTSLPRLSWKRGR